MRPRVQASMLALAALAAAVSAQLPESRRIFAERRSEFERRYDFANWPGRDSEPLTLGRFTPASFENEGMRLTPQGLSWDGIGPLGASFAMHSADPVKPGERIRVSVHLYTTAREAHIALITSLSDPFITLPPFPEQDGLPWGEVRLEGLGDLALSRRLMSGGASQVDFLRSNVWVRIQSAGLDRATDRISRAVEPLAHALDSAILAASAQAAAQPKRVRIELRPGRYGIGHGRIYPVNIDAPPASEFTLDPDQRTYIALRVYPDRWGHASLINETITELTAGQAEYSEAFSQVNRDLRRPRGLTLSPETPPGPHRVRLVRQFSDGSFEFLSTEFILKEHSPTPPHPGR